MKRLSVAVLFALIALFLAIPTSALCDTCFCSPWVNPAAPSEPTRPGVSVDWFSNTAALLKQVALPSGVELPAAVDARNPFEAHDGAPSGSPLRRQTMLMSKGRWNLGRFIMQSYICHPHQAPPVAA